MQEEVWVPYTLYDNRITSFHTSQEIPKRASDSQRSQSSNSCGCKIDPGVLHLSLSRGMPSGL